MKTRRGKTGSTAGIAGGSGQGIIWPAIFTVALVLLLSPSQALAAPCPDADGDDWGVTVSGCDQSGLLGVGDCNDSDPNVNPGAAEVCGDDVDNDCDGDTDFGLKDIDFFEDPDTGLLVPVEGLCFLHDPPGCMMSMSCMPGMSCCITAGTKQCNASLDGVDCISNTPGGGFTMVEPEGPAGSPSCFDLIDNDCDACFDHEDPVCQTAEICNSFDDDFDGQTDEGFGLGNACTLGIGTCQVTGQVVCAANGTTKCNKSPGAPGVEGPAGAGTCFDGLDNDCDALTDLADPSCQAPEACDGIDNDGDGQTDEIFPTLGDGCTQGQGQCATSGVEVCKADGTGTVCSPLGPPVGVSTEGPSGATCGDGLDNDCDGLTDSADPGCGSAGISAGCALVPLQQTPNGASCEGFYRIEFDTAGAGPGEQVIAEMLALDVTGELLAVLPVANGETAHLNSRLSRGAWKWVSRPNNRKGGPLAAPGNWHEVFAPVPLLRVKVKDNLNEAVAYCSPVPWLDVVHPSGDVSNATNGASETDVLAALPLAKTDTLTVKVNGVDIFAALGIDPATAFPGTHPGGMVTIGSTSVTISDIVVDVAPNIDVHSSNTLRMKVTGLGCGGNEVVVDADGMFPIGTNTPVTKQCYIDDMHDCGSSAVFQVKIDDPTPGLVTPMTPTPVVGEVCHGYEIVQAGVNGKPLSPAGQAFTAGGGECSGGTYKLPINTSLGLTNMHAEALGMSTSLGTFDPGSNRLIASATDVDGRRAFKTFLFAVGAPGSISASGGDPAFSLGEIPIAPSIDLQMLGKAFTAEVATPVQDSFVLGLEGGALQAFFHSSCEQATACLEAQLRNQMETCLSKDSGGNCLGYVQFEASIDGSCDPTTTVRMIPGTLELLQPVECSVALVDGVGPNGTGGTIQVTLNVPQMRFSVHADGSCHGFLWAANSTIDADVQVTLPKDGAALSNVVLTLGEENIENPLAPVAPGVVNLGSGEVTAVVTDPGDSGVSGWGVFLLNLLAEIFTLGFADIDWSIPAGFVIQDADLFKSIDPGSRQIAFEIPQVKPDDNLYDAKGKELTSMFEDAQISSQGLKAITNLTVDAPTPDPNTEVAPGFLLTPAPPPGPGVNPGNTFVAISDDVINGILAAAAIQGEISSNGCGGTLAQGACCSDANFATLDDLFPADCSDPNFVNTGNQFTDAAVTGACLGIRAAALTPNAASALCESFLGGPANYDPREIIGQATCHGVRGANCTQIPTPAIGGALERNLCDLVPPLHVKSSDPILMCARSGIPPRFLVADDTTTPPIEARLRINDTLVSILVDRANDGFDGDPLVSTPPCPDDGTTADCSFLGVCLDMTFGALMNLTQGAQGPEIAFDLTTPVVSPRPQGEICEGGFSMRYNHDPATTQGAAESDPVAENLKENMANSVPVQAPQNISLGGVVRFETPELFSIKTGSDPGRCSNDPNIVCTTSGDCGGNACLQFQDYVGVRGQIVEEAPPPPDQDGDGLECDNCPENSNPGQEDADGDGRGDVCDPCPNDAANACVTGAAPHFSQRPCRIFRSGPGETCAEGAQRPRGGAERSSTRR